MIPRATRTLRASLLGLLFVVLVAVGWSLYKPGRTRSREPPAGALRDPGRTSTGLVLRSFREGDQRFLIKAKSSQGQDKQGLQLRGVEVTFPYVSKTGSTSTTQSATITADECLCEPEPRRAAFKGNVRVTTEDGLLLETEALDYRGETGLVESAVECASSGARSRAAARAFATRRRRSASRCWRTCGSGSKRRASRRRRCRPATAWPSAPTTPWNSPEGWWCGRATSGSKRPSSPWASWAISRS